ncbi:hypothetical protein TWF730_003876 [Orbilia blumenaviensis]
MVLIPSLPHAVGGEFVNPLMPVDTRVDRNGPKEYAVHRAFVIHSDPEDILSKLKLDNPVERSLIQTYTDLPFEVFKEESLKKDGKVRVSTERAILSDELRHEPSAEVSRINDIMYESNLPWIVCQVLEAALKHDLGVDQVPAHVRDSLAVLLSTKTPNTLPNFDVFSKARSEAISKRAQDWTINASEEAGFQIRELQFQKRPNPFTIHSRIGKMVSFAETSTLRTAEAKFNNIFEDLNPQFIAELTGNEPEPNSFPGKNPLFNRFRSQLVELGTSLDPHIRAARKGFFYSCGMGAAATGLLIGNGVDPITGLSIAALIAVVSLKRFSDQVHTLWTSYRETWYGLAVQSLKNLRAILLEHVEKKKEDGIKEYNEKKEELEVMKREVEEARELLVKLAPSLRSKFPLWGKPSSKSGRP